MCIVCREFDVHSDDFLDLVLNSSFVGCNVEMPIFPFDKQYDSFAFSSLLTRGESIQALGKVSAECGKVASMSLFHVPTTKHMRLDEFEQTQSQATSQVGA